jgi:N-acylneuraminate cytidylyltransferase/CMP-N,N'-diacetyllegionaminic acid synthase
MTAKKTPKLKEPKTMTKAESTFKTVPDTNETKTAEEMVNDDPRFISTAPQGVTHDRFRLEPQTPRIICIIPARSGSKGSPDKNIKALNGKPLVWHSVEAVKNCGLPISRIVVSTNSQQYADTIDGWCGRGYVPFLRPDDLAFDTTPTYDVIMYTLNKLEEKYDVVLLLEPTSPLRTGQQINEALTALFKSNFRAVVSVVKSEQYHPILAFKLGRNDQIQPYDGTEYPAHPRRQALSPVYFMEGSIYASYIDTYAKKKCFDHEETMGYVVEDWQAEEIDHDWNFYSVEGIMRWRQTV